MLNFGETSAEMIHDGGASSTAVIPNNKLLFQPETPNKPVFTGPLKTVTPRGRRSVSLTGGVGPDVNDLAFGSVDLMLVGRRELGLDHDGVLRPGF